MFHFWVHVFPPRITTYIVRSLTACLLHHLASAIDKNVRFSFTSITWHTVPVPYKNTYQSVALILRYIKDIHFYVYIYWYICYMPCHILNIDTSKYIYYLYYICECEHEYIDTVISIVCIYQSLIQTWRNIISITICVYLYGFLVWTSYLSQISTNI